MTDRLRDDKGVFLKANVTRLDHAKPVTLYFTDLEDRLINYVNRRIAEDAKVLRKGSEKRLTYQQISNKTGIGFANVSRLFSSRAIRFNFERADLVLKAVGQTVNNLIHGQEAIPILGLADPATTHLRRIEEALVDLASSRTTAGMDKAERRQWLAQIGGVMDDLDALYILMGVEKAAGEEEEDDGDLQD